MGQRPLAVKNAHAARSILPKNKQYGGNRWPKEKNVRRPVAKHDRFTKTMEKVDEVDAEHMPYGAIYRGEEEDKQGYAVVRPWNEKARGLLGRLSPEEPPDGQCMALPCPEGRLQAYTEGSGRRVVLRAEKLAKLPKMKGGRWHPYRRRWATERMHLPAKAVAAAGGWGDTQALGELYQHVGVKSVYEAVEGA